MQRKLRYALLLLLLPAGFVVAQSVASAAQARQALTVAGYQGIHDLELDHGLWEAQVIRPDGTYAEVEIHGNTGEIFDAHNGRPLLDIAAVIATLQKQGYTQITEVDREGAVWEIDAVDRRGRHMDLRVSGYDGRILSQEREYFESGSD